MAGSVRTDAVRDLIGRKVESLVEAGLEPWEALAVATWRGGQLLGRA